MPSASLTFQTTNTLLQTSDWWELSSFKAKGKAKATQCLSNFRQWGIGMTRYCDENEDNLPRDSALAGTTLINNTWALVKNPAHFDVWYNGVPPMVSQKRAADYAAAAVQKEFYDHTVFFSLPVGKAPGELALVSVFFDVDEFKTHQRRGDGSRQRGPASIRHRGLP